MKYFWLFFPFIILAILSIVLEGTKLEITHSDFLIFGHAFRALMPIYYVWLGKKISGWLILFSFFFIAIEGVHVLKIQHLPYTTPLAFIFNIGLIVCYVYHKAGQKLNTLSRVKVLAIAIFSAGNLINVIVDNFILHSASMLILCCVYLYDRVRNIQFYGAFVKPGT